MKAITFDPRGKAFLFVVACLFAMSVTGFLPLTLFASFIALLLLLSGEGKLGVGMYLTFLVGTGISYVALQLPPSIWTGLLAALFAFFRLFMPTVTRLMNGLIPHLYEGKLTGEITVNGKATKDIELSDLASTCGSVFQNPKSQFFNTDTTGELAFGCENLNYTKEKTGVQIAKTVTELSLEHLMNRDIFKLSGGEKQQIACGSIYATDPEIYILDEPSSNMDAGAILRFREILKTLKSQGKTVIISEHRLTMVITHDMELILGCCTHVLHLSKGKLKAFYGLDDHGISTLKKEFLSPK